ncbi:Serine/threonine-protein kinase PknA [Corynebacterium glaucum]|uniref:serine/threonine-protein kinase n=1 Tax=Corynebacterium glaucum TaxID=187491 RepID=UPI0025B2F9E3|nr:serine/threonine-protein kinase [Corynebacterium glaucum]WJZ06559.1 Serine/threonine-protein kinase PknA [Corynebacterium glaucum]
MNTENRDDLQALIGADYQLQWIIGHGGMSTVWLADDVANQREVALKVLRPEFSSNEEFLARFRNEALAAEGINSPNVVATYDYREVESPAGFSMCFIAMEYIRGESLADLIAREGQLDEPLALDVLEQAAHGLAVIHRMGLVHRDIKPGNLMVTQNGQIKITDFGIAKAAAAVPLTRTGMVVGTAQYVSPEQAQGLDVGPASDVYSLSVVGYEMLTGKRPFTGDSSVSVALAHVSNEPPPMPITVGAQTRELIEIGLRKDPAQRFADGNELQLAVHQVREGERPAQPGGRTQVIATEPSPTASTQMLADVSEERTTRPAGAYPPSAARAVQASHQAAPPQMRPEAHLTPARAAGSVPGSAGSAQGAVDKQKSSKAGPWIAGLLLLALAGGGAAWAWTSGAFNGISGQRTAPTSTQTTVTETETTVEEEPTVTVTEPSRRRPSHEQSEPGTLKVESDTPKPSPSEAEEPTASPSPSPELPTEQQTPTPSPSPSPVPQQPQQSAPQQPQPQNPAEGPAPQQPGQGNGGIELSYFPPVTGGLP